MDITSLGVRDATIIGLAPDNVEVSDAVCILHGCSVPVLLRRADNETRAKENTNARVQYRLIGECYVHGMMDGEAVGESRTMDNFELI
jgi:hypothetical protein